MRTNTLSGDKQWKTTSTASYVDGVIDAVMQELCDLFLRREYSLTAKLRRNNVRITEPEGLFKALYSFEKERGVEPLVQLLTGGLVVEAVSREGPAFRIVAKLDLPPPLNAKEQFADMLNDWVSGDTLSCMERFYRRPTLAQNPADRYLDNSLESCFKLVFGFALQYHVFIECPQQPRRAEALRSELARILQRRK